MPLILNLNKVRDITKRCNGKLVKRKHHILPNENVYDTYTKRGTYVATYYPRRRRKGLDNTLIFGCNARKYVWGRCESANLIRVFDALNEEGK